MDRENVVAATILATEGHRIIGRVRLQKTFYLLGRLNLLQGFNFEYHHYGPYSSQLTSATEDAKAFGMIKENIEFRANDGVSYSVFETSEDYVGDDVKNFASEKKRALSPIFEVLNRNTSTILELAATIDWLIHSEKIGNWRDEIKIRKGAKIQGQRLDKALELLRDIGLPVAA